MRHDNILVIHLLDMSQYKHRGSTAYKTYRYTSNRSLRYESMTIILLRLLKLLLTHLLLLLPGLKNRQLWRLRKRSLGGAGIGLGVVDGLEEDEGVSSRALRLDVLIQEARVAQWSLLTALGVGALMDFMKVHLGLGSAFVVTQQHT